MAALPSDPALQQTAQVISLGPVRASNLQATLEAENARVETTQAQPIIQSLASHVKACWQVARDSKRQTVESRLLQSVRARRGEYDPEKLAEIQQMGGSDVYAGLTSVKCRAASGWIRDVMMGTSDDRPWGIQPTPIPDLPPNINEAIMQKAVAPIKEAILMGQPIEQDQIVEMMSNMRDQALAALKEEATRRSERMADKMEDQLLEGGFLEALDAFIDDVTTFPVGVLKGPVLRNRNTLTWSPQGKPVVTKAITTEWERVSPFNIYPSPGATTVDDGYLIEKHHLSRRDLEDLIGVDGYDDGAIRKVLTEYNGGLRQWLYDESAQNNAEGKHPSAFSTNPDQLIDALQFWGSVQGKHLIDWGMTEKEVGDPTKEHDVEIWLIGPYVIKAVLNYDPLCRKPYYKASYEDVPGSFWGNSVADLVRDSQTIVNATARALVNNMAMSSGPQVGVNIDRLPVGEKIETLTPWHIWQLTNDPSGSTANPITFFQPTSNTNELMMVFEKFSQLADEYSGIPRYLTGDTTGGAGRTASGLSMLINNAGKSIKQVISNIDMNVMKPMLERLYYYNMRYSNDPDLKGDVHIIARGAAALIAKEAAQVRRNEFLAATANPLDMQIIGVEGRAAILRETAKGLDMNVDKIVPPVEVLRQKWAAQQAMAAQPAAGTPEAGPVGPSPSGQVTMDGAPTTDNFSPPSGA